MKTKLFTTIAAVFVLSISAQAAIIGTNDDFSTSTGTFSNWVSVGTVPPKSISCITNSNKDYWDGNDAVSNLAYSVGMLQTGEGVYDDGGLCLNTTNGITGDEAMGLTIAGTMELNEEITFSGSLYNNNTSYTDFDILLWNLTDGTQLAIASIKVQTYNATNYTPVAFSIVYKATAADAGDTLQLRFVDTRCNSNARDIFVDNFELTSFLPAPGTTRLIWDFNNDSESTLLTATNISSWSYTSKQAYVASNAVANTLAFTGGSTLTDYMPGIKGYGHEKCLYWHTLNLQGANAGIYVQKLDFRTGGMNSTNQTRVNWSFDILGTGHTNVCPSNWTVRINYENTSQNISVSDAWFNNNNSVLAQTFNFNNTGNVTNWVTISGSYLIPVDAAGDAGGIQIRQPLGVGGYISEGGIYLDNIQVTLESVEPVTPFYALTVNNGVGDRSYTNGAQVVIVADAISGKAFVAWTGDTQYVASVTSSTTTVTMPAQAVTLTATYTNLPGWYTLTVINGTGGGTYTNETQVPIAADVISGKTFTAWTGDTQYVDSVTSASATVTMPATNVALTATYTDNLYTLTVNNGSGSGSAYTNGQVVPITADAPASGYAFAHWTGDTAYLADSNAASTTVTMPLQAVTVTATYIATEQYTTNGTPYSWLTSYGLTNYEADAVLDQDNDGLKAWQEYIAGTNPTNAASVLKAAQATRNVVTWTAQSNRIYSVYWSTNLTRGFTALNTNIVFPQNSCTNTTPDARVNHYQVKVRIQQ